MKITLVLTDSSLECGKAIEMLAKYEQLFSAEVDVLVILEDLYRLESASVSLGVPLPPDTVNSAKNRALDKIRHTWRHIKGDESADVDVSSVAGEFRKEVLKFIEEHKPDMILWGCHTTSVLCNILNEINIPSVIIK